MLVGLGLLLPRLASALADALLKAQDGTRHVDVSPSDGAKLTAPETGNHCEPNQGAPVRVFPRLVEDAGCRLRLVDSRVGVGHRVRRDLFPADCAAQRTAENEVDHFRVAEHWPWRHELAPAFARLAALPRPLRT